MGVKDYYRVLGVTPADSLQDIRNAYRNLAKQCHPDYAGEEGQKKFQEIQEAYEVLSDPWKRKAYDASLQRPRQRRATSLVTPEPLVPRAHRPQQSSPESLIAPSFSRAERFASPPSSPCSFCDGLGWHHELPCPFCHGLESVERDMEQLILNWLRLFRTDRF
jgi:DnaJ-class molecular chaperone